MRNKTIATVAGALALAAVGLTTNEAEARRGFGRGGPGGGPGGFGGPGRCAAMLMHAHPERLKEKVGVNDAQLAKLKALRNNVASKRITLRAQLEQQRLKMRNLMEQDLPPQNKVLQVMRKMRSVRGVLHEERVKAGLKALRILTPDQRKKVRARCGERARQHRHRRWGRRGPWGGHGGKHWGPGSRRGRGGGPGGGGRGPGGPGGGGPGGGGPGGGGPGGGGGQGGF